MTEIQLYVLSVAAIIIVAGIKALTKAKVHIGRGWLTAGVYVVAGALAFAWSAPMFPVFPAWGGDLSVFFPALFKWFSDVLIVIGPVVGFATLVYNALWAKVEEGLNKIKDKVSGLLGLKG
jgi:hypothetical protein